MGNSPFMGRGYYEPEYTAYRRERETPVRRHTETDSSRSYTRPARRRRKRTIVFHDSSSESDVDIGRTAKAKTAAGFGRRHADHNTTDASFGSRHHQYADDTYLYVFACKEELTTGIQTIERCASALYDWLSHNGLALNPSKLEVIQFSVVQGPHTNKVTAVNVADATIAPSPTFESLGVALDAHLKFDDHVIAVCKACYFHIRALRHIRASLPDDVGA